MLGPPELKQEPLRVWLMALALVLAAATGAGLGLLYHHFSDDDSPEQSEEGVEAESQ